MRPTTPTGETPTAPPPPADQQSSGPADSSRRTLIISVIAYAVLATGLAIRQAGYVNADFIGYATIAHRALENPARSVSAHWSPLFSWCMAPLIGLGVNDLVAGQIVLLLAGAVYIIAFHAIAGLLPAGFALRRGPCLAAVMACVVLQP